MMRLHFRTHYILVLCVLFLVVLCYQSIHAPLYFAKERQRREVIIQQRLRQIGVAEEHFKHDHGSYCGHWATLINQGYVADSVQYVPFTHHRFKLSASVEITRSGRQCPQFECSALYTDYLFGLDEAEVSRLTDEAYAAGKFPGMRISEAGVERGDGTL